MLTDYTQIKHGLFHGLLTKDRFRLTGDLVVQTRIKGYSIRSGHVRLMPDGTLVVYKGFEWDGASGPTWDTDVTMEGSCVHDALYRLMADGLLPLSERWRADTELWYRMRNDGAPWWRAGYYYTSVQAFGKFHV